MRGIGRRASGAVGLVVIVGLLVGACSAETPPVIGISQIAAYSTALHAVPAATDTLSGRITRIRTIDPNQQVVPPETWVWVIVVSGRFAAPCGASPAASEASSACPSPATTETVILDYSTGRFIEALVTGATAS